MRAAITAASDSIVAQGTASAALDMKYDTLQSADAAGEAVLKNCRLRMVKLYGGQFNSFWQAAGWPNGSTAIPSTQDERFTLLGTQKTYFTLNPTAESGEADATAAICQAAHTAVSNARHGSERGGDGAHGCQDGLQDGLQGAAQTGARI